MNGKVVLLPLTFIKFWYFDAPLEMAGYFGSFNNYFMELFALGICLKTFFNPLKNEYREGLIGFSRVMGIFIKSGIIITDLLIYSIILLFEFAMIFFFLAFPIITVSLLFL